MKYKKSYVLELIGHANGEEGRIFLINNNLINATDKKGNSLLHYSIIESKEEVAEFLIEHDANINLLNSEGACPLELAIRHENKEIVRLLLSKGVILLDDEGYTALHCAAATGNIEIFEELVIYYTNVNLQETDNLYTPLHWACQEEHTFICKKLLEKGADPNIIDDNGISPLHQVSALGNIAIFEWLIKYGADINSNTNHGAPLHSAVAWDQLHIVKRLLDLSALVNIRNKDGNTPLHYAYLYQYDHIIQLLLQHGADPTLRNNNNAIPADITEKLL